jgi:hypothetical protein
MALDRLEADSGSREKGRCRIRKKRYAVPGKIRREEKLLHEREDTPYSTILQTRHVMFFLARRNKSSEGSENDNGSTTRTSINIVASS